MAASPRQTAMKSQREQCSLLRRESLVGGADLALRRPSGADDRTAALEGQRARRGVQVGGHVERVEPAVGQVPESARERQLHERGRGLQTDDAEGRAMVPALCAPAWFDRASGMPKA